MSDQSHSAQGEDPAPRRIWRIWCPVRQCWIEARIVVRRTNGRITFHDGQLPDAQLRLFNGGASQGG